MEKLQKRKRPLELEADSERIVKGKDFFENRGLRPKRKGIAQEGK